MYAEKHFSSIGLTRYQGMIYLALLKHGILTGRQVSERSGVPHGRAYEILRDLVAAGFAVEKAGKVKLFSAVRPEIAVKQFCAQKIRDLSNLQENLVVELEKIRNNKSLDSVIERVSILAGSASLRSTVAGMLVRTRKEYCRMYTYEQMFPEIDQLVAARLADGIKIRFLATKPTEQGLKWMKSGIRRGIKVRYYPVEELRIHIRDSEEAVVHMLNPRNSNDRVGMHAMSREFASALAHYFNALWDKALVITEKTSLKELNEFTYKGPT